MKKLKMVILPLVAVLILSGCGNKSLTCTMSATESGMKTNQKVEINLKNNKVDTMKVTIDVEIPDEYADQKQSIMNAFKELGTGMEVEETEKGIKVTADQDSSYFDAYNIKDGKVKYDDIKEAFESQNYTCK